MEDAIEHVKHKYGRRGYALISDLYKEAFKEELEKLYEEIEKW